MENYEKIKLLGNGLFSQVFSAKQKHNQSLVALKITIPDDERPPHDSEQELNLLKLLQNGKSHCNNIITLIDSFEHITDETELIMVLPYLQYDLKSILKSYRKAKYPSGWVNNLPLKEAYKIIIGICKALEFLHDEHKIIHRDIKPENILFDSITGDPILIDFGISWIPPDNNHREPTSKKITDVGTTIYRAPELLFGISSYSYPVDLWALGCIIGLIFSEDGTTGLFEPYNSDIGLFISQVDLLGTPTVDSWPDIQGNESFLHMNLSEAVHSSLAPFPLAPDSIADTLIKLLSFQSTDRPTAKQLLQLFEHLV